MAPLIFNNFHMASPLHFFRCPHKEQEMSTYGNPLAEYSPQMEAFGFSEPEFSDGAGAGVLSESDEMELAAELLEVSDERELDQFLGSLISKVGGALKSVVKGPIGSAIGGALKGIAGKALPIAGGALGGMFGGPLGATLGSGLASMAGNALGLELEGLSREDQEFEATKRFVRFCGAAIKNALEAPQTGNPAAIAHDAVNKAAQEIAPGLVGNAGSSTGDTRARNRQSGRWVRQHGKIIVHGI
jgi:hypothetical protein